MKLYIGNKNYSSWSMRPWVLLTDAGLDFEEVMVRFDSFEPSSQFKQALREVSPTGRVPVLVDGDLIVWDTLAIAEYAAEKAAAQGIHLWPVDAARRARARSLCAEMHSGFGGLRSACPMNIEASLPEVGARVLAEQAPVRSDLSRLDTLWNEALDAHGGPWLMGESFTVADSYFAPVVMRVLSYGLPLSPSASAYVQRVKNRPSVAAWVQDALAEQDFLDFEEPYRQSR